MARKEEETASVNAGFASDLAGLPSFLIDPEGAAKHVRSKWFWIVPLLLSGIIGIGVTIHNLPYAVHAASVSTPPNGLSTEQYTAAVEKFTRIGGYMSPIIAAIICAVEALLLLGMAAIMGASARFGQLFNLAAGCGIIQSLSGIAASAILHFKGEVSSMAELRPAMGLDIFLPEGTSKVLVALAASLSVFQIWWIVMLALTFAAAFHVSKAKGFIAMLPLWFLGFCFALLGTMSQN